MTLWMDAAPPFASNYIFDAAYEAGANYANMGTWSVPMEEPAYGLGIENSYTEPMTKYNFDRHEQWKKKGTDGSDLSWYRSGCGQCLLQSMRQPICLTG